MGKFQGEKRFSAGAKCAQSREIFRAFFKEDCSAQVCTEGKRKKKKRENFSRNFHDFCRNSYFFRAVSGCVNKNPKCFVVDIRGGQEEEKLPNCFPAKGEKNAPCQSISKITDLSPGYWITPLFRASMAALTQTGNVFTGASRWMGRKKNFCIYFQQKGKRALKILPNPQK